MSINKNENKAFIYYTKSAEKGYSMAQNNLAIMVKVQKKIQKKLFIGIIKRQKMEIQRHNAILADIMSLYQELKKMRLKHLNIIINLLKKNII